MNAATVLADTGNIGLAVCAVLDTAAVTAYWARAHGGERGKWWRTPFGWHLMCFMTAFAIVLDQSVIYLLTGPGLLAAPPPGLRPDWFAWERVISFAVLIPAVLAWRLYIILRPPRRLRETVMIETKVKASTAAAALSGLLLWCLGKYVFNGNVPDVIASWVYAVVPGLVAGVAGYLAPHTNRPALPAAPATPPAGPAA